MLHSYFLPQWRPERDPALKIQYSFPIQILSSSSTNSGHQSSWNFHVVMILISREKDILSYLPLILSPSAVLQALVPLPLTLCVHGMCQG